MSVTFIPKEFDISAAKGFTMAGWNFTSQELLEAQRAGHMLNPAFELGTNMCPWNCDFCFTEDHNPTGAKRRLPGEMTLEDKLRLIDEAAALGCRTINIVGAGEPTIDQDFWQLLDWMQLRSITPIVYTEAALKLTNRAFAERLFQLGATVVVKVNSLRDEAYQNAVVEGTKEGKRPNAGTYFKRRNQALEVLMDVGFNRCVPTRLAFDTIICKQNVDEILDIHRHARANNIFVLFVNYLPSGRTVDPHHSAISREQQFEIFGKMAAIDRDEFGIEHDACYPYAGGTPCSIRGFGLFVKIKGDVFDCPGESQRLGNFLEEGRSLKAIWERAAPILQSFNGGCLPRKLFWDKQAAKADKVSEPSLL